MPRSTSIIPSAISAGVPAEIAFFGRLMLPIRQVIRLARKLQVAWESQRKPSVETELDWRKLQVRHEKVQAVRNSTRLCIAKNLMALRERFAEELRESLQDLAREAEGLRIALAEERPPAPDLRELTEEIRQLESEFGDIEIRWANRVIRVVTDEVLLRGVRLGRFALEFAWNRLDHFRGARSFDVIALEPNTPTGRDDITHPHVQDGALCAGDAAKPLEEAVTEGRLADAFILVRSVLKTYNSGSPYVPLAEWDGFLCSDCGRRGTDENRYSCESCGSALCDECAAACADCSESRCADCLETCDVCSERYCRGSLRTTASDRAVCKECLGTCACCGSLMSKDELTPDTNYCTSCHSTEEETGDDQETEDDPAGKHFATD